VAFDCHPSLAAGVHLRIYFSSQSAELVFHLTNHYMLSPEDPAIPFVDNLGVHIFHNILADRRLQRSPSAIWKYNVTEEVKHEIRSNFCSSCLTIARENSGFAVIPDLNITQHNSVVRRLDAASLTILASALADSTTVSTLTGPFFSVSPSNRG
jgi:hypothetical protein